MQKAYQVAVPGMRGRTGAHFLPVRHQVEPGRTDFCHSVHRDMPSQAVAPMGTHALCTPLQSTVLGAWGFCRMAGSCLAIVCQGHVQPAA